ncbi:hypothetical protein [Vagococcus acidifermentans]|nr:hypothetical protein [Vagococcus acidifermentans]
MVDEEAVKAAVKDQATRVVANAGAYVDRWGLSDRTCIAISI